MATEQQSVTLTEQYQPVREEVIPCVTEQSNFPHDRDRPWVRDDGICSICGAEVEYERLEPINDHLYTCIAAPHSRTMRWFAIDADDLQGFIDYMELY